MAKEKPQRRHLQRLTSLFTTALVALAIITAADLYRWPDSRGLHAMPLQLSDGTPLDLQHTEQPVFLYFWGSWCGICRHTMPQVQSLQAHGHPVVSVALHSGSDSDIAAHLAQHGWHLPFINDADGHIAHAFGITAVPTIAIVENGKIRLATSGWSSAWGLRLRYAMLVLIKALRTQQAAKNPAPSSAALLEYPSRITIHS